MLFRSSGVKRSIALPDIPTIVESGLPGYEAGQWFGMLAPAGTPALVIDQLGREIKTILTSEDIKSIFLKEGVEVGYLGTAEFSSLIASEITKWTRVVKEANIIVK